MISERACRSFDELLARSVRNTWGTGRFEISELQQLTVASPVQEAHAAMLSVSSICFRLALMLHYDIDEATRQHFSIIQSAEGYLDDDAVRDAIAEDCNLMCGALNRYISRVYPHIGMSTPRHLKRESVMSLERLNPAHVARWRLLLTNGLHFHVTFAASAHARIDFAIPEEELAENVGELELF